MTAHKFTKPIRALKSTSESWAPSYVLDGWIRGEEHPTFVEVSYLGKLTNGRFRTCVWGGDDKGMDFDSKTAKKAWSRFLDVIRLEDVTEKALTELGFVPG